MAQLTTSGRAKIDRELDHALRAWSRLPEVEATFESWPEDEALTFAFEWTLEEELLHRLAEHAKRQELTPRQRERYRQLVAIVDRHRPIVDRLLDG